MAFSRAGGAASGSFRTSLVAGLILAVTALIAWHNSFSVPFVFDDELAIVNNPSIRSLGTAFAPPQDGEMGGLPISGRPVVNLSVAANYAASGFAVSSYHVVNLLIHFAAAFALFALLRRTLTQSVLAARFGSAAWELALLVAALWLLHPLQTESVTYISQRAEALLGLWYFLALLCYVRAAEENSAPAWRVAAIVACALGMMTKEVMVSVPLFAALYDRAFLAGSWREVWSCRGKLLLSLAATWLILIFFVAKGGGTRGVSAGFGLGVSPWTYLLKQCDALVLYLKLALWPQQLVLDYGTALVDSVAEVWWQGLLLLALFATTLWTVLKRPAVGCLGAWFFLILAPSSSVIPLVGQTVAEHRMYLPLAALVVGLVLCGYAWLGRRALPIGASVALAFAVTTIARNDRYASAISICEDTVAKQPTNARAMALLADYHHRAGHLAEARKWLERSLAVQPGVVPVLNNLGSVCQELGDTSAALGYYQQALDRAPHDLNTLNNLGNALLLSGRTADGLARLFAAVQYAPRAPGPRANLAAGLAQSGNLEAAAEQFTQLVQLVPQDADAHFNLGNVLASLNRAPEALPHFAEAVRLRPNDALMRNRYGMALGRAGQFRAALDQFNEALRLDPSLDAARQNAVLAQRRLGSP